MAGQDDHVVVRTNLRKSKVLEIILKYIWRPTVVRNRSSQNNVRDRQATTTTPRTTINENRSDVEAGDECRRKVAVNLHLETQCQHTADRGKLATGRPVGSRYRHTFRQIGRRKPYPGSAKEVVQKCRFCVFNSKPSRKRGALANARRYGQ